jgi:anti-anti-sigma factor
VPEPTTPTTRRATRSTGPSTGPSMATRPRRAAFERSGASFGVRYDTPTSVTVAVYGELDLGTASRLDELVGALLDRDVRWIRLDATGIAFMDCSGLRVLVQAARRCARERGDFSIVAASAPVERLLELAEQRRLRAARRRPAA